MVLLQTTVHEVVHGWLVEVAAREGSSVASVTRRLVMLAWEVAPDVPKRAPAKPARRAAKKASKRKKVTTRRRQLELPETAPKRRRTRTQKRGLDHIEPEAAQ